MTAATDIPDVDTAALAAPDVATDTLPGGTWYVIRTRPALLADLAHHCQQAGVMVYYPQFARRIRVPRTGQRKVVHKPVFPGYAFVPRQQVQRGMPRLPAHLRYRYQFVRSRPDRYAEVWPKLIETMVRAEQEWCRVGPAPKPTDEFTVGQYVEVYGNVMPPMRVSWVGRNKLKVEAEVGPIEVTPDMVRPSMVDRVA